MISQAQIFKYMFYFMLLIFKTLQGILGYIKSTAEVSSMRLKSWAKYSVNVIRLKTEWGSK